MKPFQIIYVLVAGGVFVKIVITLIVVFIISILLIFKLFYSENRQESKEEKMSFFMVLFLSLAFSLLITGTLGLSIFALIGSTNMVNIIFSLGISTNQLMILAISFFVYLFILDDIIEIIVEHIVGKNIFYSIVLVLTRIGIFYVIGNIVGLTQTVSITIAIGVTFITFLIEVLFRLRERKKQNNLKGE